MKIVSNCTVCGEILKGRQKKFCSSSCKNKVHQSYSSQKARGLKRKMELVDSLGGGCSRCGYSKNLAALSFHHKNDKNFKLDVRSLSNRTFASIRKEIGKCELLCQNCHSEVHNPDLDLASDPLSRLL